GLHSENANISHILQGAGIFAGGVKYDKASIRVASTLLLCSLQRPADRTCDRARLPTPGIAQHRQMASKQAIWINADCGIGSQWACPNLDMAVVARLYVGVELDLSWQSYGDTDRRVRLHA